MRTFEVPQFYRSPIITKIKNTRKLHDARKKDFSPTCLDFGSVKFWLARHFGFCYGVENAIEMAYKAIENYPDRQIYFLSEMIHNPHVNQDLQENGIKFIMNTYGEELIDWSEISKEDVVLIPAFGTTIEMKEKLDEIGLLVKEYDTTCPFVAKVWNRSEKIAKQGFSLVVHGKPKHEETRATFSHAKANAPTIVIKNIEEAKLLGELMLNEDEESLLKKFKGRFSDGFKLKDLDKLGVVNQTTMLASETQEIASYLKGILEEKFDSKNIRDHFADTRDTLCYATNDNQQSTYALLNEANADMAIVVGGYNSSNTTHLLELCEQKVPSYFISSEKKIISENEITHFDIHEQKERVSNNYLPEKEVVNIILTSGASCPDSMVEAVMNKVLTFFDNVKETDKVLKAALADY